MDRADTIDLKGARCKAPLEPEAQGVRPDEGRHKILNILLIYINFLKMGSDMHICIHHIAEMATVVANKLSELHRYCSPTK